MDAPALPWGTVADQSSTAELHNARNTPLPNVGDRIEVKWQLEHDDGTSTSKWWGAKVEAAATEKDVDGKQLWTLRYDAYGEFPEEFVNVTFIEGGFLKDKQQDVPLRWKLEGEEIDDDSDGEEGDEDVTLGLEEINEMEQAMEEELGMPVEQAALKELEAVPMDQQMEMIAGFRNFVDHFKVAIKERLDSSGGSYTMTADDVHNIMAKLKGERPV